VIDYLTLSETPCGEECAQVGSDNYYPRMRRESRAYIGQLERMFPNMPDGVYFKVKGFPHDMGTYHEVCIIFDDDNAEHVNAAYNVERSLPEKWDSLALADLAPRIGETLESDLASGQNTTYDKENKLINF